jgi:hypothetical protein
MDAHTEAPRGWGEARDGRSRRPGRSRLLGKAALCDHRTVAGGAPVRGDLQTALRTLAAHLAASDHWPHAASPRRVPRVSRNSPSRMFDAISIFCRIIAAAASPGGARSHSVAMSGDAKPELSKRTSRLAGRAAASTGGMNWPWAIIKNRVSTNSCTFHACQRCSARLGRWIHSVTP